MTSYGRYNLTCSKVNNWTSSWSWNSQMLFKRYSLKSFRLKS